MGDRLQDLFPVPQQFSSRPVCILVSRSRSQVSSIPLHVWLPDAMEGPTISALIHAATMVAAGCSIARMYPVFEAYRRQ